MEHVAHISDPTHIPVRDVIVEVALVFKQSPHARHLRCVPFPDGPICGSGAHRVVTPRIHGALDVLICPNALQPLCLCTEGVRGGQFSGFSEEEGVCAEGLQ